MLPIWLSNDIILYQLMELSLDMIQRTLINDSAQLLIKITGGGNDDVCEA
jgi:hypothetical protein